MKSLSWIYFGEQGLSCTHNLIGGAIPRSKMVISVFCASLNTEQFFSWLARCDRTIIPSLHHHHLCLPPTQPPEPHGQLGRGLLPWLSPSSSLSSTVKFHLKYPPALSERVLHMAKVIFVKTFTSLKIHLQNPNNFQPPSFVALNGLPWFPLNTEVQS